MLEADVTLTDYALALEAGIFAWILRRRAEPRERAGFLLFFGAIGLGAALGGTTHGFVPDESSMLYALLWGGTMLAVGLAAVAMWSLGAVFLWRVARVRRVRVAAWGWFALYAIVVLFVTTDYLVVILGYLPAVLFLLVCSLAAGRRQRRYLRVALGLALTLVAAIGQQGGFALPMLGLTHNAVYHLVQIVALAFAFAGARLNPRSRFAPAPAHCSGEPRRGGET